MNQGRFTIRTRLIAGFSLLVGLVLILGGAAVHEMAGMAEIAESLQRHPMTVSNAALDAKIDVLLMRKKLRDAVTSPGTPSGADKDLIEQTALDVAALVAETRNRIATVRARFLGSQLTVDEIVHNLSELDGIHADILGLLRAGRRDEALARHDGDLQFRINALLDDINDVIRFARNKSVEFSEQANRKLAHTQNAMTAAALALALLGGLTALVVTRGIVHPLRAVTGALNRLAEGDGLTEIPGQGRRDEVGQLAAAADVFKDKAQREAQAGRIKSQVTRIGAHVLQATSFDAFAGILLSELIPDLGGGHGVVYVADRGGGVLRRAGSYGHTLQAPDSLAPGEGLAGQCLVERRPLTLPQVPEDYFRIGSALGSAMPSFVIALPLLSRGRLLAVIEIASFAPFSDADRSLLDEVLPLAALALDNLDREIEARELLAESQAMTEELESQSEELRTSEEEIKAANEELTEKSQALEEQHRDLEQAREVSERRAESLEKASRYKSEFLANMSHELRTPLNSLLILARGFADNEEGNLSPEQIEAAAIIRDSGLQLLELINNILDLSKIEAGRMDMTIDELHPAGFAAEMDRRHRRLAAEKNLDFSVEVAADAPETLSTDPGKVAQIVSNLIANAIKFTSQGSVRVTLRPTPEGGLSVLVADTGIGIPIDKLERIFEAFEQADGSTSRNYGGTGLGLSISSKLARMLGGDIHVDSTVGVGSVFVLDLPASPSTRFPQPPPPSPELAAEAPSTAALPTDDNGNVIGPGDAFLLIVEEDADFRKTLCELSRRKDVRCVAVGDGEAALDMVRRRPPAGIILDTDLPAMGGWTLLERLKSDPDTRRIPVHFVSASNESSRSPDGEGASGDRIEGVLARIAHAAANKGRRLLIVDDDPGACAAITSLVGSKDVTVTSVGSGEDALDLLRRTSFDCVILDLGLPGMSGFDFLERAAGDADVTLPPVVVHSGRDLTREESMRLREYTDSIVIKGTQSPERLLDEVTLFLHSIHSRLPERQRRLLEQAREHDEALAGKTVLVVDDDMRNAFALSRALRPKGLEVRLAQDGRKALSILDEAGADIVLMDIMMPGMDGYETMRAIRSRHEFAALPVIAITAKAMPGDRQKCIEAGASDYLTKPVDMERLLSMMAVWLHQE